MQPRKPPLAEEPDAVLDAAELALAEVDVLAAGALLLALDVLLPHAAISRVAAPAAATVATNEVCLTFPPPDQLPTPMTDMGVP
jgi:hypothetical protein